MYDSVFDYINAEFVYVYPRYLYMIYEKFIINYHVCIIDLRNIQIES